MIFIKVQGNLLELHSLLIDKTIIDSSSLVDNLLLHQNFK